MGKQDARASGTVSSPGDGDDDRPSWPRNQPRRRHGHGGSPPGACYNRPGHTIIDHYTYTLASDGDLMEGVTFEACALAGHLGLGNLSSLYDDNGISLAGATALSFTEDVEPKICRLRVAGAYVTKGNNITAIDEALASARGEKQRPTLIRVMTCIGFGAPTKEGTARLSWLPPGPGGMRAAKERLGWPLEPSFLHSGRRPCPLPAATG